MNIRVKKTKAEHNAAYAERHPERLRWSQRKNQLRQAIKGCIGTIERRQKKLDLLSAELAELEKAKPE